MDLRCCEIGQVGSIKLASLLIQGSMLTQLLLGGNRAGDRGAEAFSVALTQSKHIRVLDLSNNGILDQGLSALAEGVSTNATLGELKLWGNSFGDGAASLFLQLFEGRFQYYELLTDFRPYTVDDRTLIAQQQ